MPIVIMTPIRRLTHNEFGDIAYEVMGVVYRLRKENTLYRESPSLDLLLLIDFYRYNRYTDTKPNAPSNLAYRL